MKVRGLIAATQTLLALLAFGVQAASTELATAPLSGASEIQIFPNILFVLDDSGSMNLDALPDWALGAPLYRGRNSGFNGIAYNPSVLYSAPSYFTATGLADTTTYPGQTSLESNAWAAVIKDGYNRQAGSIDLRRNAFYYTTIAGEYCADQALRKCQAASAASSDYPYPANLRWCNSAEAALAATPADGACRATQTDTTYKHARTPEPHSSQLTIAVAGSVSSIKVDGQEILSTSITSKQPAALATSIVDAIEACKFGLVGNCQVVGYRASEANNVVTIIAPAARENTTPVLTQVGSIVASKFGRWGENKAPGDVRLTVITDSVVSYPKADTRTDCGGIGVTTCSYDQEMANYANWSAYYRTRMAAMKTASSLSFAKIDETRRVGYMSINNGAGSDFLNIAEFTPQQKKEWYDKLFAAVPGPDVTPLRAALSKAGHLYAGKYNGSQLNNVDVHDPVQYYCQKNTTILSTDGYWNQDAGFKLDGTALGDQDGSAERPQYDGGAPQEYQVISQIKQIKTPTWATQRQMKTQQLQSNTWQLQSSTAVPQSSTQQLMTRTTDLRVETSQLLASKAHLMASTKTEAQVRTQTVPQSSSGQLWKNALTNSESYAAQLQYQESKLQKKESTLQFQTSQLQTQSSTLQKQTTPLLQTITRVQEQTSNDGGVTLSAWKDVAPGGSCDEVLSGDFRRSCRLAGTTTAEASSCLVIAYSRTEINPGKDNHFWRWTTGSSCAYGAASGYSNAVATCEAKSRSTGGEGSTWIGPATDCQYTAGSGLVDAVGSCTAVARSAGPSYDVLTARDCQYTAWTAPAAASSACTNAPRSGGPTYTVLNARNCAYTDYPANWTPTAVACTPQDQDFKNLIARQCLYTGFGAWMDTNAKCTPEAEDPTNYSKPVATQCRYSTYTWKDLGSPCQKVDETANPGPYTVAKPVSDCRSTWTGWGTSSTCEVVTGQVDCKYEWTAPVNDASCPGSAVAPSGGPKYTVEKPKACSNAFTGWSAGVCPDPLPQGTECRTGWKPWANTDLQCTKNGTKDDLAAPVGATDCSYAAYAWLPVSSCTTVNKSGSSPFKVIEAVRSCTYGSLVNGAWTTGRWTVKDTKASTCKQQQSSGAFPWTVEVATRCTYPGQPTGWTTAPQGCTLEGQSGNDFVPKRECQYGAATTAADDASCPASALGVSPSSPYTVAVAKTCSYRWTSPVNIASCKENATTRCTYAAPTGFVNAATCAEAPQASGPDYPGSAQACQTVLANPEWTNVAGDPCSEATSTVNGLTTSFRCVVPPPTEQYVAKCDTVDQLANDTNHGVTTDCKTPLLTETKVDQCTPLAAQDCPTNNEALCKTTTCRATPKGATPDTLADVAQYYYMTDLRDDTALHNCAPDGDNARNVCESPDAANSDGKMQRMTTYTLGLGASGLMQYAKDYPKAKEADGSDFASVRWATTASPTDGICSWQHAGVCNWPTPVDNSQTNIDDLWHAAVNGRGTYFSAGDPSALAAGISSALADIGTAKGALAAVTLASANLLTGGNGVYEVSFEVGVWAGDVAKRAVNGDTGEISDTVAWSAEEQLRKKMTRNATQKADHSLRTIYTYDAGTQDKLKPFLWDDLSDVNQAFLSLDHINGKLSQFCSSGVTCLGDDAKLLASGKNLLNFLRGDSSNEGDIDNLAAFYRKRSTSTKDGLLHRPLGDIAGSEAVYVQAPPWNYVDKQYSEFKAARKDRTAMVYVGANDGMLHAFEADTGKEAWAYVPALVFSRLYQLADKSYAGRHLFTVDGTPVMGDICADSAANCASASNPDRWKTILVGGLNAGGRGYYALDVSNPATPKALWEFRNDNLGYTYGNPVISKLKDGTWVVIVASGYNNVNPGDGKGRLFILNANTGELMTSINADGTIVTAAGDATTPSGLARITAWANFPDVNNTAERVYGGDLQGNLWRFDINGDLPPDGYGAQRLATLTDPTGKPQPITTRPELGKVRNYPVVFIGTGKLLGPSDFNPIHETAPKFQQQSFYAIKDRLTEFDYGDPRKAKLTKEGNAISAFNTWTLVAGSCPEGVPFCRTLQTTVSAPGPRKLDSETSEQYAARLETREQAISDAMGPYNDGWYIDLPSDGEQSNTDPNLQRGSVVFTSNRPLEGGGCVPKAASSRYFLDYRTGGAIEGTNGIIGVKIADALATRAAVVVLTNDQLYGLTRTDQPATDPAQIPTPPPGESARRISWRELSNR